jgi:anti-sigma regulatory factor (Ser/Thr protein kinase)
MSAVCLPAGGRGRRQVRHNEKRRRDLHELLQLPAIEASPARARRFVGDALVAFPVDIVERAQLLISELVTNAVVHGEPPVVVEVETAPSFVRVAVEDQGDQIPMLRNSGISDGHGRGLQIVAQLADQWGVALRRSGKAVWFRLSTVTEQGWSMN